MFPLRSFQYNFTLDNSNNALSAWQVGKKKQCTEVQNIEFISKQSCQFFVFPFFLSLQFKFGVHYCILIKLCCLIPCSKYQSLFLAIFEVKCAWYMHSLHIHFCISLFPVALHKCHLNITMLCLYCFTRSTDLISIFSCNVSCTATLWVLHNL